MKKILFVSLTAILFGTFLCAQVTLTYPVHGINVGDVNTTYAVDTTGIVEGPSGSGQTWDFSNCIITSNSTTYNYVAPFTTTYSASYPNANLAITYSSGFFGYYNSSSAGLVLEGVANSTATIVNSNTEIFSQFPFSFSNSFSDNFYSSYMVASTPYIRDGVDTITADGSGTLILPTGSYPVLREKIVQWLRDTAATTYAVHYHYITYQWYSATDKFPLFSINYAATRILTNTTNSKTVSISSTVSGITENISPEMNFDLFPNPTTQNATLNFEITDNQQVNIFVSDLEGKTILEINHGELSSGKYSETIDVASLSKGIYFIKVQGEKSFSCKKLVVE